jgi:spermidine/putrescine-binding protein
MYLLWNNSNPVGIKVMKPCEIPSMDNKISPSYSGFYQTIFVVPKKAKNIEAAKKLIQFISSSETAEKWIKYSECPTGLKTQISYSDFGQEEFEQYFRHLQNKYGNNQLDVDLPQLLFGKKINIDFKIEDVLKGHISANEALEQVKKQVR